MVMLHQFAGYISALSSLRWIQYSAIYLAIWQEENSKKTRVLNVSPWG
jgi:hypothetical protein